MTARCLRCGAGNEWIEGTPTHIATDAKVSEDAARYRWWRECWCSGSDDQMNEINDAFQDGVSTCDEVDAAIDAARQANGGKA